MPNRGYTHPVADSAPNRTPEVQGGGGVGESTPVVNGNATPRPVPGSVNTALRLLKLRGLAKTPNPELDTQVIRLAKKELLRGIIGP